MAAPHEYYATCCMQGQLQELWVYAESIAKEELQTNQPESFEELDAEEVSQVIGQINQML